MISREIYIPTELGEFAKEILSRLPDQRIFCFHGDLGAGKTTFIKSFCKELGVEDSVHSPTFSIVNEYRSKSGSPVYHFDFYRLKNETEAFDLGYEEYLFSGNYCFIEWPEKIESLLDIEKADIFITVEPNSRLITCRYE
ncbi:tRNA (adenosine(37)-N6)-threonylcarbamoyltransferase complex ATPase subunit type 1 TsaE [soil metagenome]